MKLHIFKAKCPVCPKIVFHVAEPGSKKVEYFDVPEMKMLVIVATPEVDGVKRIALGPCQRQEPFYREGEEPVVYFAHVRHACHVPPAPLPIGNQQIDTSSSTSVNAGSTFPSGVPPVPDPINLPVPRSVISG